MRDEQLEELARKRLCHACVGDKFLSDEISSNAIRRKCSYCGTLRRSYSIGEMADRVETVFDEHYSRTSDQPTSWQFTLLSDKEGDYDWERDGEPVVDAIMNSADMPSKAAEDILAILQDRHDDFDSAQMGEESPFGTDTYYEEKGTNADEWHETWGKFERALKTEARFFSQTAADYLASVFEGIDGMGSRDGRRLVADGGPDTAHATLYRARVFQSEDRLMDALCRPDRDLGAPPAVIASAGRMNARGISVFYGASEQKVALAEVRPPVGSQVAIARFDILRPVRLLDLAVLNAIGGIRGSVYDPSLGERLKREMFLRTLGARITRPVMPDDEALEYLATQAIADFLATGSVAPIDGIIFPSVQTAGSGVNIVLFHKTARTEDISLPPGTRVRARSGNWEEDGFETDYAVTEELPAPAPAEPQGKTVWTYDFVSLAPPLLSNADDREPVLRIDVSSLTVHHVTAIEFKTTAYKVRRIRFIR